MTFGYASHTQKLHNISRKSHLQNISEGNRIFMPQIQKLSWTKDANRI